jgi:hypothetical protein
LLYIAVNGTAVEIGSGRQNTMAIVEKLGSGDYAALACSRLTMNAHGEERSGASQANPQVWADEGVHSALRKRARAKIY